MKVLGFTNALTDYVINMSDEDILKLGINKGHSTSFEKTRPYVEQLDENSFKRYTGGGPCNTIIGMNSLGVDCSIMGVVGDDEVGRFYVDSLKERGIASRFCEVIGGRSGRYYTFISPNGERSFSADKGVAFDFDYVDFSNVPDCDLFHSSGYELYSSPKLFLEFAEKLKRADVKISFDLGYAKGIGEHRGYFENMVGLSDVLFSTEEEADEVGSLERKVGGDSVWVLKRGECGSSVRRGGCKIDINPVKIDVVNVNGAGDGYAAGFLTKYLQGKDLKQCGDFGSRVAAKVCGKEEAYYG